jgi:PHD/YefM family antitoxin component YafN of YafNO toxin-antitoxin module
MENQPIFITKNGKGDMVVMSQAHYERICSQLELYSKLGEAEILDAAGEQGITHHEMIRHLKKIVS